MALGFSPLKRFIVTTVIKSSILPQDGHEKQDCENAAPQRLHQAQAMH